MKIFSDNVEIPTKEIENLNIKSEPTFYSHQDYHENPTSPVDDQYNGDSDSSKNCNEPLATYYTQGRDNKKSLPKNKLGYRHPTTTSNQTNSKHLNQPNCRSSRTEPRHRNRPVMKTRHSVDKNDLITRCAIRQSTNHWAQWCPERNNQDQKTFTVNEIVLHQSVYNNTQELKTLMSETWSSALLDGGASKTVWEKVQFNQ